MDLVPAEIAIQAGEEKILIFSKLQTSTIRLEEGAKLTFILLANEGWEDVAKVTFELSGRHAEIQFLGFILGNGKNNFAFETFSHHTVPETKGHFYVKAVMFDQSLVDYKGNIIIEKPAQLSDSYLAHHTMLLSDQSRARSIPALEIEADDVKAGHAATIGKVEEELMFYLCSRGVPPKEAEQMLIEGFFAEYVRMVPDEKVQEQVYEWLKKYLMNVKM